MFSYGMTDVGKWRESNQDSFIIDRVSPTTLLAVVCDGMGGAAGGLEASTIACSVFADSVEGFLDECVERFGDISPDLCRRALSEGVVAANAAVYQRACEDPGLAGMGTTLVAALVCGGTVYAVNVGDSRLYALKDGVASQITKDHSYVQLLVDMGRLTEEQARTSDKKNIITRAVGTAAEVESDLFTLDSLPDALLLCSDGLTNMLTPEQIAERIDAGIAGEDELRSVCASLVDGANDAGGLDNITAAIVSFAPDASFDDDVRIPIEEQNAADAAPEAGETLDIALEELLHLAEGVGGEEPGASDEEE